VPALAVSHNALFVGDGFATAGGKVSRNIACWQPRVNWSQKVLATSPAPTTIGNDVYGFYKPALMTTTGTVVSYSSGIPTTVTLDRADEIWVGGKRVNGAFTLTPDGVQFGGAGATLRVEFSEDDAAAYGTSWTRFVAARLTYPSDYPVSKEAANVERVSNASPVRVRAENGREIYVITVPFGEIASTYGAVPKAYAPFPALPPVVSGPDSPTSDTRPTWTWVSGGGGGIGTFRRQLDSTSGSWTVTTAHSWTPPTGLSDGPHTLFVQERDDAANWSASGSFTVVVDTTTPRAPVVSGLASPTGETRPTWTWVSGGGGNGTFRRQFGTTTGTWTGTTDLSWKPDVALDDGPHTLFVEERDDAANWSTSGSCTVTVLTTGSLRVTIAPQEAVTSGAQWRRVGTAAWFDSGDTESGIALGSYNVEFKPVVGWTRPTSQSVTITRYHTTETSGTYTQFGSLQVFLMPQPAVGAGAMWRREGTAMWRPSGETEYGVHIGSCVVEFKDVDGWDAPLPQNVNIALEQTTITTGTYTRQMGSLRVTLAPQEAVTSGARWRRVGTGAWLNSGEVESGIPVAAYSVEFKSVLGWRTPLIQGVTINKDQITSATGVYVIGCPLQLAPAPVAARDFYDVRYRGDGALNEGALAAGRVVIEGNTKGKLTIKRLKGQTAAPMLIAIESSGTLTNVYSEAPVDWVSVSGELRTYTGKGRYARRLEAGSLGTVTMEGRSTSDSLVYVIIASAQDTPRTHTVSAQLKGLTLMQLSAPNQQVKATVSTKKTRDGVYLGAVGWLPRCDEESWIEAHELLLLKVAGGDIQVTTIRSAIGKSAAIKAQALNLGGRRYGADIEAREVALGAAKATIIAQGGNIPSGVYTVSGAIVQFAATAKRFPDGAYGGLVGMRGAGAAPLSYGALLAGGAEIAEGVDVASGASGQPYGISLIRGDAGICGTFRTVPGECPGKGKIAKMQTLKAGDKRLPAGASQPTIQGAIFIDPNAKPPVLVGDKKAIEDHRLKVNDCTAVGP